MPNSLENLDSLVRLRPDHGCNLAMNFEQLGELLIFRTPSQAAFRSYTRRSGEVTLEGITYTEAQLNGFSETELPKRFDGDDYQLLILGLLRWRYSV